MAGPYENKYYWLCMFGGIFVAVLFGVATKTEDGEFLIMIVVFGADGAIFGMFAGRAEDKERAEK